MSAGLKLFMILLWFVAFSTVATAQSAEEDELQTTYKKMFGGIEVSCETLLITEYEGDAFLGQGKPRIVPFDMAECARQLASTEFSTYLQPLFDGMALVDANPLLTREELAKETLAEMEQRLKKAHERMALMQDDLQRNIRPLVSLCRELGEKYNGRQNRVCFFGAPSTSAGQPFRALFRAMVDNTQPSNETLCAPDPIGRDKHVVPELLSFLGANENTLSWADIQQSLLNDKFECRGEGYLGGCSRSLMTLAIPSTHAKEKDGNFESFAAKDGAVIIPRVLTAYRGSWQTIGPGPYCLFDAEGKAIDDCEPPAPQRGSEGGICLTNEDWHVWSRMIYLLNKDNDSE